VSLQLDVTVEEAGYQVARSAFWGILLGTATIGVCVLEVVLLSRNTNIAVVTGTFIVGSWVTLAGMLSSFTQYAMSESALATFKKSLITRKNQKNSFDIEPYGSVSFFVPHTENPQSSLFSLLEITEGRFALQHNQ